MQSSGDSSDSGSSSSSSSKSSSSSSSSSESSSTLSGSDGLRTMSADGSDTDEENTVIMGMAVDLLQVVTETCVLNPHLVAKCPQLDLVLINFKFHDPKRFRHNLRVSASTFDSLLEMIETHPIFLNDANISQSPVNKQLAVAMFRFGHNGNAASVEAVAQWAGVSAGTVVNCTRRVFLRFMTR
jgi:hypothetical protein